jgi:large subunit ribosomal protein L31
MPTLVGLYQVLNTQREKLMKTDRHPLYAEATITCSCGATLHTRSTVPEQRVSVCSQCHPYFGGRHQRIDTVGRIDAFQQKYGDVHRFAR